MTSGDIIASICFGPGSRALQASKETLVSELIGQGQRRTVQGIRDANDRGFVLAVCIVMLSGLALAAPLAVGAPMTQEAPDTIGEGYQALQLIAVNVPNRQLLLAKVDGQP